MKRIVLIIISLSFSLLTRAQVAVDTLTNDLMNHLLSEQIERLAEDLDEGFDYEDLVESYRFLLENPLCLNSEEALQLTELNLISAFQYEALQEYRKRYGDLLFPEELLQVEGFDQTTLDIIRPVVYFGKHPNKDKLTLEKLARYGRHSIVGHYEQVLEKQQGYLPIDDSLLQIKPNARYLGSPQRYQLRYTYNYRDKIRAGFVTEKDPGELSLSDFVGFHLYVKDLGVVKAAVAGDYHLTFGQGLTLWSGMSFGKAFAGSGVMKQGRGIRPKASATEYGFFRGAAVTLGKGSFSGTVFYSNRKVDANVSLADSLDEVELVSSLQETGYHRTFGELQDRHAVRQQMAGGHLNYASGHLEIGYTLHHTWLDTPLQPTPTNYNQYYFQGTRLTNQGIDFKYIKGKYAVFGEVAMSIGEGDRGSLPAMTASGAGLIGLTVRPAGYLSFTLMYREYGKAYQDLYSNAFGEGSRNQGQRGMYLGMELKPAPYWDLTLYADQFRFTWLTSQVNAPSWGHDYYLRLSHSFNQRTNAYLQMRSRTKMKNSTDAFVFSHYPIFYTKSSVRFNIDYGFSNGFVFSTKAEYAHYRNDDGSNSHGYLLCQDVSYKPEGKSYSLTFRYALFDTDDYDARVYAYESDVLYSYYVPALYGKGMRLYLLGKWNPIKALTLYARIGSILYTDRDEISSELTLIEGNHKTDLKVEVVWKF
jgi:hypothetical protein